MDFPVINTTKHHSLIVTVSACLCHLLLQMFAAVWRVPYDCIVVTDDITDSSSVCYLQMTLTFLLTTLLAV